MREAVKLASVVAALGFVAMAVPSIAIAGNAEGKQKEPAAATDLPKDLPSSETSLRQFILDTNRKIDDLTAEDKDWLATIATFEDLRGRKLVDSELGSRLDQVQKAAKDKNKQQVLSAMRNLDGTFFGPFYSMTFLEKIVSIGSAAGPEIIRYQREVRDVLTKYQHSASTIQATFVRPSNPADEAIPTGDELKAIAAAYSVENQKAFADEVFGVLDKAIARAKKRRGDIASELTTLYAARDRANEALDKSRTDINQLAIQLGLPLFCGTVILLFAIPFVAIRGGNAANGVDGAKGFPFGTLVEISTVLLLTMSILILGLAGKLEGPVLGTLLGGISGYVLNRVREGAVSRVRTGPAPAEQ